MNHLYENLKYIREKKNMSMEKFAEFLNTSSSNISRWENKNNGITVDMAYEISKKLEIPLGALVETDLRIEENVILDEDHKLDRIVMDKSKELSDADKEMLIGIIESISKRT